MDCFCKPKKIQTKSFCRYKDILWPDFEVMLIKNPRIYNSLLNIMIERNVSSFEKFKKFAKISPKTNVSIDYRDFVFKQTGSNDAPPKVQKLFRKAFLDSGVENPNQILIKIMNDKTIKRHTIYEPLLLNDNPITNLYKKFLYKFQLNNCTITIAFINPYGVWINPIFWCPEKYYYYSYHLRNLINLIFKKRLDFFNLKTFMAYHEAGHRIKGHNKFWYAASDRELLIKKNLLLEHPLNNEEIEKKILQKREYEADESAVSTLYRIGKSFIVEEYIKCPLTTEEHRNNVKESLKKWDMNNR